MKTGEAMLRTVVGLLIVNVGLFGCGGGSDSGNDAAEPSATGTWGFVDPAGQQETMTLTEDNGTISGTTTRGATVSGTRNKSNADIHLHYPGNRTITVVVVINGDTMSGTVSDSDGGSGTIVIVKIITDGNPKTGLYVGTETFSMSMSGIPAQTMSAPFALQVDKQGQVLLPSMDMTTSGGGVSAHTMISHTQTGNTFTLTAGVDMGAYGSLSFTYTGTVTGNTISGTISGSGPLGMTIGGNFQLTRQ